MIDVELARKTVKAMTGTSFLNGDFLPRDGSVEDVGNAIHLAATRGESAMLYMVDPNDHVKVATVLVSKGFAAEPVGTLMGSVVIRISWEN